MVRILIIHSLISYALGFPAIAHAACTENQAQDMAKLVARDALDADNIVCNVESSRYDEKKLKSWSSFVVDVNCRHEMLDSAPAAFPQFVVSQSDCHVAYQGEWRLPDPDLDRPQLVRAQLRQVRATYQQ